MIGQYDRNYCKRWLVDLAELIDLRYPTFRDHFLQHPQLGPYLRLREKGSTLYHRADDEFVPEPQHLERLGDNSAKVIVDHMPLVKKVARLADCYSGRVGLQCKSHSVVCTLPLG